MIDFPFFLLIIIISLFGLVINTDKNLKNITTLKIQNGQNVIASCNVTFSNNKKPDSEYFQVGKVWHFSGKDDIDKINEQYLVISHIYMFVFDNFDLFQYFNSLEIKEYKVNGLIIANSSEFNNDQAKEIINSSKYSVFMFENKSIDSLFKYDIRNEDNNYFLYLSYSLIIYQIPLNYVKWMSLICLGFSLILLVWWNIKVRYTPEESLLLLQKLIVFLPYLNVILCGLISFQMFSAEVNGSHRNNSNIYIDTILVTIRAIFRTVLWFFIVLVASGWQLVVKTLSRDDIKSYIKIYVFIYIVICIDQILDAFSGTILKIFYPSEIKNILFYFLMALGVLQKGLKTVKFLRTKLHYARYYSRDYIPSLYLKLKMMYWHIGGVASYFVLYCIVLIIQKVIFPEYNMQEFLLVNYHALDIMLVVFYLLVYRPRILPNHFNIEYGEDEEEISEFGIFNNKIPNINEIIKEDDLLFLSPSEMHDLKEDNQFNLDKNNKPIPIVLINPVMPQTIDVNKKTINNIIDHLSVGFITS